MIESAAISVLIGTFVACSVEVTEMVVIVVGVGATRGWRSTWFGAGSGLLVLAGIVAGLGQALQLIPINVVRVVIGALLLTFGLQWYRQGVIQIAADGFSGEAEEDEEQDSEDSSSSGGVDWTAFVLSFKGVLLEGLEVAFIVVAFGAGGGKSGSTSGAYSAAYIGAAAAFVFIGTLGLLAKRQLAAVPGRALKFGVGGLLATFGTFWSLEGLGVHWPGGDVSLAWLYALYLSSTFLLMRSVRAGLLGHRPPSSTLDPGPRDASGLAPASAAGTQDFQRTVGLTADGVVGPRTQAAVRSLRAERNGTSSDGARRDDSLEPVAEVGIDAGDAGAIATLQRRLALPESAAIDGLTRGAVRLLQLPGFVDPLDEQAVSRFQSNHQIEATGDVDEQTRVALRSVLADSVLADEAQRRGSSAAADPIACFRALDCADPGSVHEFQRSVGLPASGDVEAETRGAMRALRAWLAVNPLDGEAIKSFQDDHDLRADGVIGPRTRKAIANVRQDSSRDPDDAGGSEPDPFDERSVRAFQREHGLAADGHIGPRTREAILWAREHDLDVDPAAPASIRAFQRAHRLRNDGVIGPETQAAMRAARGEREPEDPKARQRRYGAAAEQHPLFDAANAEQVRRFQREHGLEPDGIVGAATQTALASVRAQRRRERIARAGEDDGGSSIAGRALSLVVGFGRFWYDFVIGDDWVAAFGVVVMIGGVYALLQTTAPAFWLGPIVILTTALVTIVRALRRRAHTPQGA